MSLEENAGRQDEGQTPQSDSLLPLDFKESSAQKRKPLPLGQFMRKSEQRPIIEPTPGDVEAETSGIQPEPAEEAPAMETPKTPVPLAVAPRAQEPQAPAPAPAPEAPKAPVPLVATPRPLEPQPAAISIEPAKQPKPLKPVELGSAAKPIPLTTRPKPLSPVSSTNSTLTPPNGTPRPLKPATSGPRTFSEKDHAAMKQQASKAAEVKRKPLKPTLKPSSAHGHGGARLQESTLGGMLLAARNRANLTIQQVEDSTRIKKSYLEALESDNPDDLPPRVFISAYVRNLSALYGLSAEDMETVNEKLKELGSKSEVPETLIQNLEKDGQVNMAEEARVRKMLIGLACAFILIVLWVSGVYIGLKIKHSRDMAAVIETSAAAAPSSSTPAQTARPIATSPGFDSTTLERFIFQQNPTMTELKVPSASSEQPKRR